jgi:hypothetical protein
MFESKQELEEILKKCSEYCETLSQCVFHFVCYEDIEERLYSYTGYTYNLSRLKKVNKYLYDYQLIWKKNEINERRIQLEENGQKKYKKDASLNTKRFKYRNIVFGPIGLLSAYWQDKYAYKIQKKSNIQGRDCIVIGAVPKKGVEIDRLFGKIWLDQDNFSILKIEWNQKSLEGFDIIEETAKRLRAAPKITLIAEYEVEKNGIRFPSRFIIKEEYIRAAWGKVKLSEIFIKYKDYKFFTVETAVKIK